MREHLRKSGIDVIGDVPWGTHICQFYQTKEDLMEILITYFKAGLENNEFCLWVTSQPVEVEDAEEALKRAVPDFNTYLEKGQIEIIPYTDWFIPEGVFDSKRVASRRFEKLKHALESGYDGMRLSGNTTWLEKENWSSFIEFKEQTDKAMDIYRMINLCTYFLGRHNAAEIIDVVVNHQFALIKSEGIWKRIDSPKRKQAEEAALQATKNWEYTFDAVPDLISILDTECRIIRANKAMAARLGVTPEECVGLTCYRVIHGMDEPPSYCPHRQMLKDELEHTREVREDNLGGDFIVSVSPLLNSEGKVTGCIHIARDITERKQTEEALSTSEELLRFALETSHTGAWDLDLVDHTAYRSLEHDRIFGYEQMLPEWTYEMFIDHVLPEDRAMVDAKFREATNTLKDWNFECRIRRVDGEVRWIWAAGRHRMDASGNMRRMAGILQDITGRKQLEEKSRQRVEEIETMMEVVPVAIWIGHDPECHNITGNRTANEFYEAEAGENVSANATPVRRFFHEGHELTADGLPMQKSVFKDIDVRNEEIDVLLPSGEWITIMGSASPLHDAGGHVRGSVAAFMDITERKRMEKALKKANETLEEKVKERTEELEKAYSSLKENEKSLAEAQKMSHIGNWDLDLVTNELYASDEMCRIFGLNPQGFDASYEAFLNYAHPADRDYINTAYKDALNGKKLASIDYRIIRADGEERVVYGQGEVICNEGNIPVRIRGTVQDITERKRTEKALELSEERYRIVTEQTGQLIYDYNVEKGIADWAGNIRELTGFTPNEFRSMNLKFWLSRIHPEDINKYLDNYKNYLVSEDAYRIEYRFRKKNEEYIYFEDNGICLRDRNGKVNRILGVIKDITERKKAETFLANLETARKKEIHHRIKNNLQVISSLLDLQMENFSQRETVQISEVLKAFRESQDRVMSIALIHEELHEGRVTDKLNFSPYLEKLVKNLFQTYWLGNVNTSLNIELEENIFFDMDIAVPLGIIINELVSNALKYAFPDKDKGLIEIKLYREESSKYANSRPECKKEGYNDTNFILKVSDNGVGIPESFNSERSETLGLQLVAILVDQLGGELELKRDSGTEFVIRFTVEER
jgi:PAS domain S-box-containing protein